MEISHQQLYRASWKNLVRLARWKGYFVLPGPEIIPIRMKLVEALAEDIAISAMQEARCHKPVISGSGAMSQFSL